MNEEEFRLLFYHADIYDLARAATKVRDRRFPEGMTTFVIDRNINYTNICSCKCSFCAFYRDKSDTDAYVIDEALLYQKIDEALDLGATQLMIQGGLNRELGLAFFENMFKGIKARYDITIHSLTAPEVAFIARNEGLTLRDTLRRLRQAGLDSLPGGGAEILHDEVRSKISPHKIKSSEWLDVMHAAHQEGIRSTATMMMGTIENLDHRLYHLKSIRDLQDETGGFRAFIVWTYQPGNNELMGEKMSSLEYLRFLALCRLYLDNFDPTLAFIGGKNVLITHGIIEFFLMSIYDDIGVGPLTKIYFGAGDLEICTKLGWNILDDKLWKSLFLYLSHWADYNSITMGIHQALVDPGLRFSGKLTLIYLPSRQHNLPITPVDGIAINVHIVKHIVGTQLL
jgi:cyclic dehypoxanthinyl futalosine synthase